jgi:hypothetical protein
LFDDLKAVVESDAYRPLVEVKKSIYAMRAKQINKMKKAKHKIQWANLACWISRFASFDRCAGKRKNRCN